MVDRTDHGGSAVSRGGWARWWLLLGAATVWATLALLIASLLLGCSRSGSEAGSRGAAAAAAAVARIQLGQPEREYGGGLEHVDWEADGRTRPAQLAGQVCRQLQLRDRPVGYFYFRVAPRFKQGPLHPLQVHALYWDGAPGRLWVEYDGRRPGEPEQAAYRRGHPVVGLSGDKAWKEALFVLPQATLRNSQNGGADFRLATDAAELGVAEVTLRRGGAEAVPGTNWLSVSLSAEEAEGGQTGWGLWHIDWEADGRTCRTNWAGSVCWRLDLEDAEVGYLYFALHPALKRGGLERLWVEVEYWDEPWGWLGLQYDARPRRGLANPAYAEALAPVPMGGLESWQSAVFQLNRPRLANRQNGGADFRLWVRPAAVCVRRLTVTRATQP